MAKVKYVGGVDEVYVRFPSGDTRTVKRGETVDILDTDAETLSPDEWTTPTKTPKGDDA